MYFLLKVWNFIAMLVYQRVYTPQEKLGGCIRWKGSRISLDFQKNTSNPKQGSSR